jgi:RNA polymerase sigma factor (sigma-70 family)
MDELMRATDMAVGQSSPLMQYIRRVAYSGTAEGATDGQLLEQYLVAENQAAFAALVKRHGPMVHAVCRRVLGNAHDADDAFQAVFIVLMRKARTIMSCESLGGWLHGVAYRTALKARSSAVRRLFMEKRAAATGTVEDDLEAGWQDLRPILDQEIARLPENYRLPFVLCYLEGKTNAQAARQLRWPLGTVATRLARAREHLRKGLTRRGAGLAAGLLIATASRTAFAASVSNGLGGFTTGAAMRAVASKVLFGGTASGRAIALAKGVVQAMWMSKVRSAAIVLVAIGAIVGGGRIWLGGAFGDDSRAANQERMLPGTGTAKGLDAMKESSATVPQKDLQDQFTTMYQIQCTVYHTDKDGKKEVLAGPKIVTPDGAPASVLIGTGIVLPGKEMGTPEYVEAGLKLGITLVPRKDGRLRVDCDLRINQEPDLDEQITDDCLLLRGITTRYVKLLQASDAREIEFEQAGPDGSKYRITLAWKEFKIKKQESPPDATENPNPVPDAGK